MLKFAIILCALSSGLFAQWPSHPTPGVPRKPDGKPDLAAPAPRSSDGKPDLSGVWMPRNSGALFYITQDLKPGDIRPWADAIYKQRQENYRADSDGIHCMPPGPKAGIGVGNFPLKIIQTPSVTAVLYEYDTVFRQIFTDGRGLPKDPNPTWMGYSVGRWDGDTLVVTTTGYNNLSALDLAGHPHSEALRLTERYRRRDIGHMDLQVTFEDPEAYTRSWTVPIQFDLMPDGELIEYVCENERDQKHLVGKSGQEFQIPSEALARYAGVYDSRNSAPDVTISLEGNHLMIDAGAGKVPLVAHSDTSFTMEGTGIEFVKDKNGAITALLEHWVEGDRYFARHNN